jgi:antirestriction protein ArdC
MAQNNWITRKPYRGVNVFSAERGSGGRMPSLAGARSRSGRLQALGGRVRKGAKSTPISFWKVFTVARDDGNEDTFPILRRYAMFNVGQVDWAESVQSKIDALCQQGHDVGSGHDRLASVEAMFRRHKIAITAGANACYIPSRDHIVMPPIRSSNRSRLTMAPLCTKRRTGRIMASRLARLDFKISSATRGMRSKS